jgi:hypothetical protein
MLQTKTAETPTIPITFRATESQVARLHAVIPAHRKRTGENATVSGLVRECIDRHIAELAEVK